MKSVLTIFAVVLLLVSCKSAPPIPRDASAQIYFQRAQSLSDDGEYVKAMKIYQDFLEYQPEAAHEDSFSARYEIAVLQMKKNRLAEAQAGLESILADYNDLDKSSGAPAWVKILSQKMLQEVKDRASKPKKWFGWFG